MVFVVLVVTACVCVCACVGMFVSFVIRYRMHPRTCSPISCMYSAYSMHSPLVLGYAMLHERFMICVLHLLSGKALQLRGIKQLFCVGGHGTQKGAAELCPLYALVVAVDRCIYEQEVGG